MKRQHVLGDNKIFVEQSIVEEKTFASPLILIHGSFGNHMVWNMIVDHMTKLGFECYAISLRSHKPSGGPNITEVSMQDYVDDVSIVVNELKLENSVIIGHSMGGLVALMYSSQNSVRATVTIGPSATQEIRGSDSEDDLVKIPPSYDIFEAGMPKDPMEAMEKMPDISQDMLMKMKDMLVLESGKARKDRKRGISISKEKLAMPLLMIGSELENSLPFGVPLEITRKMAEYYGGELRVIDNASHPGIIMGNKSPKVAEEIENWLKKLK